MAVSYEIAAGVMNAVTVYTTCHNVIVIVIPYIEHISTDISLYICRPFIYERDKWFIM